MKKLKNACLFILISCLLLFLCIPILAANYEEYGSFTGRIIADKNYPLKQIEIKVYSSTLSQQNKENGLRVFHEEYAFSVFPDENGNFTFDKPSANFSVTIDTATLPAGTGTDFQTKFYPAGIKEDVVHLSTIDTISAGYESGTFTVNFYNSTQSPLYVDYKITGISIASQIDSTALLTSVCQIPIHVQIQYSNGTLSTNVFYMAELSGMTQEEKIRTVYHLQQLSNQQLKEEQILGSPSDDIIEVPKVSSDVQQNTWLSEILQYTPTTYVENSTYGYRVYYDPSTMDRDYAQQALASLLDLHSYYVIDKGFTKPIPYEEGPYLLYLTHDSNTLGVTYSSGRNTLIIVNYDTISTDTVVNTVIAHEYMHGISDSYFINKGTNYGFMSEGCSNFSTYIYACDRGKGPEHVGDSTMANLAFLRSPHLSLNYVENSYEPYRYRQSNVFFWLNLYQNHGGWNMIKKILEQCYQAYSLTSTTLNYSEVVEAALQQMGENETFEEIFAEFVINNYKPAYFYSDLPADWDRSIENGSTIGINDFSMPGANLNGTKSLMTASAHYQRFTADISTPQTLTVTIDLTSTNNAYFVCKMIRESYGHYDVQDLPLQSGRITIQQERFGGALAESVTLVPMNTQLGEPYSSYIRYTIAASVSYS